MVLAGGGDDPNNLDDLSSSETSGPMLLGKIAGHKLNGRRDLRPS